MTVKNNNQLIETMTLLIMVNTQYRQCGVLSIDLMIDQVKEPFLKKGLLMIPNGYNPEYVKDALSTVQKSIPPMFIGI
jgi:flagellar motor component MotA